MKGEAGSRYEAAKRQRPLELAEVMINPEMARIFWEGHYLEFKTSGSISIFCWFEYY